MRPAPPKWSGCEWVTTTVWMSFTEKPAVFSRCFSACQLFFPGSPGSTTARPRSSRRPYMFTWPRPGIQIGSCIRMTPGATSVTSSEAGSCSCFGGLGARSESPGRRATSVTTRGYPLVRRLLSVRLGAPGGASTRTETRIGLLVAEGELGPGAGGLHERGGRDAEVVLVTPGDDLHADRHPVDEPGRDAEAGLAGDVERRGERG